MNDQGTQRNTPGIYISENFPAATDGSSSATTISTPVANSLLPQDILTQIQTQALQEAERQLQSAAPALIQNLENYATQYTQAVLAGQNPSVIPAVTVFNEQGKELTKIDAKNRSFRTLLQGFGIDVLFAIIAGLGALNGVNFFNKEGLALLGILVSKTVVQTAISYIARMKITPTYQQ